MAKVISGMSGAKVSEDKTHVVFMGIDAAKEGSELTAYWLYDGKEFTEISKDEYEEFKNGS